jgi:hypothetical protein
MEDQPMPLHPVETTNLLVRVSLPVMLTAVFAVTGAALIFALLKF